MENYKRSESIEQQLRDLLLLGIAAKGCWLDDKPAGELLSAPANIHCLSKKICQVKILVTVITFVLMRIAEPIEERYKKQIQKNLTGSCCFLSGWSF